MNYYDEADQNQASQKLQVWACRGCRSVHFKTGNVLLNFSKQEFAELTHAVLEIYGEEFGGLDLSELAGPRGSDDEILSSRIVA